MQPRLVSYRLCSFAQRVAIVLHQKAIAHEIEYIELSDPPKWFLELLPFRKVPLLHVDGQVLWESSAINEYLDEAYPNKLHPADPVLRAKNRAWIELGNQLTWAVFQLSVKETESEFLAVRDEIFNKFDVLEAAIEGYPFFNGEAFSLVDASYAPLLQRLGFMDRIMSGMLDNERHPRIIAWKDILMDHKAVLNSCVPEIGEIYYELLWKRQGYISQFLDKSRYDRNARKSLY